MRGPRRQPDGQLELGDSARALQAAAAQVQRNGFDEAWHEAVDGNLNHHLRQCLERGRRFDAIVLDPAEVRADGGPGERACTVKDISRLALKLLQPGGPLFISSCSGGVGVELFHMIVAGVAVDTDVDGAIVQRPDAAPDHPATLFLPEGEYLKGLAIVGGG